ncbi:MAG TPA: helix-turn-helix domain-containing protein [Methanothrix sp.]|jgi:ArsR family transcriptional regulator|nr:helix-turn-helix domain-containing protein [Methanothrix sp.]HUM81380.1 helix-turn-helix domain-containing protein [Methanothrix sp.]
MILDPVELLDILGNENRRRILQLLSFRPFYFNEMAKRLDVGPKAIIDHLEMLERAGLVECYQEQGRRKYFRIKRRTVLEVALSPHSYGVRAYLSEDTPGAEEQDPAQDLKNLKEELSRLEMKRQELRLLLEQIEGREMEIKRRACQAAHSYAQDELEAEILSALLCGDDNSSRLADKLEMAEAVVADRLRQLKERGAVHIADQKWSIR